jgi:HK97 family phage prohead protease
MLVHKTLSFNDVELKLDGDSWKFSGYASKFGGVDSYGDTILKGAFAETLSKSMPKMFYQHDWNVPVGKWLSAREDDVGLFMEGELTKGHSRAADAYASMKHGTLDGLSIGGYLKKGDFEDSDRGRTITKWSSLVEVSAVVFPADGAARIETVKSGELLEAINEIDTIREFERFLRDASGLSKSAAVALTARAKQIFLAEGEPSVEEKFALQLQERLDRILKL